MTFKEYSFRELLMNIVDNRGRTCPTSEHGIPLIATNCIKNSGLYPVYEKLRYVSEETYQTWFRGHPEPGDMIFVCKGSPGRVCWTPDPVPFCIAQDMVAIRADTTKVYPKYLFALLRSEAVQHQILNMHVGTLIPHFKKGDFANLYLQIPEDMEYQRRVGDAYFSFCESIEKNHQINQTLEQMAQAIFKSWFVDFEPVKAKIAALEAGGSEEDALLAAMQAISGKGEAELTRLQAEQPEQYAELRATDELFPSAMQDSELGEIPEGWSVGHLSELIQFNPRRSLKKGTLAPYLDMKNVPTSGHLAEDIVLREMNSGTKFINGDSLLARITPCLENGKTAYVDFLDSDEVGWGSTEYIVMRSQEPYPESLSYFIARNRNFRQHAIQSMTGTSGRQRANAKALAELPWIIYPQEIAVAFGRIATPYLRLARSHGNESKSLSAIRDSLLPKLLSGELEITRKDA